MLFRSDPSTAGTVQNVGLMAQKAEEYGSHPTTFEIPHDGTVRIVLANGDVLHQHKVEAGDIWRAASTRQAPIEDWVKLAISRQKAEGCQVIFWLDETRAHDAELIRYVKPILEAEGVSDRFRILAPREATRLTLETIRKGENSIAITGNVLRDYLTDLFPILELGTSAKMLSIVKLMNGGGLFETGAGGSAPKHVQQILEENHLRWDSLGEFLALAESFRHEKQTNGNEKAGVLAATLDKATERLLNEGKSPSRKAGEIDNRGSHFFLATFWAEELANQSDDADLAAAFKDVASQLSSQADEIAQALVDAQGNPADLGGYYWPNDEKTSAVMRPVAQFNEIIDGLKK
mgnify:CR=1 FL=1